MTLAAATNCWTNAVESVVAAIPQSASFRSLAQAADVAAAAEMVKQKSHVPNHLEEYFSTYDLAEYWCWALVCSPVVNPYRKQRSASGFYEPYGTVSVLVVRSLLPEDASRFDNVQHEEDRDFENAIGTIIDEVLAYLDDQQTLRVRVASVTEATVRVQPKQRESRGNLQYAVIQLEWGFQG